MYLHVCLCLCLCVCWNEGGNFVFVWFSSFPLAFKWAGWIQPSTRTAFPQSLMVPVLSIRHPGTDLRTTLCVFVCLCLWLIMILQKTKEHLIGQNDVLTFEAVWHPGKYVKFQRGEIKILSVSVSPIVSFFNSLSRSLACPTRCLSFLSSVLRNDPSWLSPSSSLSLSLSPSRFLLSWSFLRNHSDLSPLGPGPLV